MRPPASKAQTYLQDALARLSQVRQLRGLGDPRGGDSQVKAALDDLQLAQAMLDAEQKVVTPQPTSSLASIGALLPPAAVLVGVQLGAQATRRVLPKLWASETRRFDPRRPIDLKAWWKGFLSWAGGNRPRGSVSYHYARPIIDALYELASGGPEQGGKGSACETMDRIAEVARCCIETFRKFIRAAEAAGWVDSYNRTERPTKGRLKGQVIRAANVYIVLMPEEDLAAARAAQPGTAEAIMPDDETVPFAQRWLGRLARQLKRGEQMFRGLAGRTLGLNLTPLRNPAPS